MILTYFPLPEGTYTYTSPYGWRTHPITGRQTLHRGTDLAAASGTLIRASIAGRVTTGYEAGGAGNWINITSGNVVVKCFHLSGYIAGFGQNVAAGDPIGYVGTTGASTGAHLHFELWQNGYSTDPGPELHAAPYYTDTPTAPAEEEEDVSVIAWNDKGAYEIWGLFKRGLSGEDVAALRYIGVKDIGRADGLINVRTEVPRGRIAGE